MINELSSQGKDPLFGQLIPISISVEIKYKANEPICETITLNLRRTSSLQQATNEAIINFNTLFQTKKFSFKFRDEGTGFNIQPADMTSLMAEHNYHTPSNLTLEQIGAEQYIFNYNPQDIMINMRSKSICDYCIII